MSMLVNADYNIFILIYEENKNNYRKGKQT